MSAPAGSTRVLFGALLAVLLFFRKPASLLHPQFWAEDGSLFFQDAFNHGFWPTVLQPASGYLHSFPRIVAGLSLLAPLEQAPLVFNLAAFAIQLLPALYLLSPRMARFLPSFSGRAFASLLYVALPASQETHVNLTNSHWYLALMAVCILVAERPAARRVQWLETAMLLLFSLTGPFSILFLPLVAPRLLEVLKGVRTLRSQLVPVVIAAGGLIQLGFASASARIGAAVAQPAPLSLQEMFTVVSLHTFFNAIFGINGLSRFYRTLPPAAHILGLCVLAVLLYATIRDRVKPLLILFYLAALSIALSFLFPLNDLRSWLHPQAGPRYFLFAALFIHLAILHLALAARSFRSVGRGLLATAVVFGIRADFFHPVQPDTHWADHAAVFRSLPPGSDFYMPLVPLYHLGLTLHKKSAPAGPPVLSGLDALASRTPADFSVSRPAKVTLAGASNDSFLLVAGWAIDSVARQSAAGVYVMIDDKVFPAVTGLPAEIGNDGLTYANAGFSRLIPIDEIGPGSHQISIAVLTGDGSGYFRPPTPRTFTTGHFFPRQSPKIDPAQGPAGQSPPTVPASRAPVN